MMMLSERMLEDMKLRGLSESTQEAYARVVRQLATHYKKSPDQISDEELRQYFLYLKNVRGIAESTLGIHLGAIKFYYQYTLKKEFPTLEMVRIQRIKSSQLCSAPPKFAKFWELFDDCAIESA